MADIWKKLTNVLGTDDGTLPEIEFSELSQSDVVRGYDFVRTSSSGMLSPDASYWDINRDEDVPLSWEDNPAEKVVVGQIESFHTCFKETRSPSGIVLPVLGLYTAVDELAINYRRGSEWAPSMINELFDFLRIFSSTFDKFEVNHVGNIDDMSGSLFQACWRDFRET